MKSRRLNVSDDRLTISRRNTRSITLVNGRGNSLPISIDLVIEIFSWLPAKSIARCRCVSKLWNAVLRRPDFTELHLSRSSSSPKLLFVLRNMNGFVFFTSHLPQNPVDNSSIAVASNRLSHFPCRNGIVGPSNGFVLLRGVMGMKKHLFVSLLFNPSTGQVLPLPAVNTRSRRFGMIICMGCDSVNKQLKVLSVTLSDEGSDFEKFEYQVLTVGIGKPSWRMVECCRPHLPGTRKICINGVYYYTARVNMFSRDSVIVCFDFISEKFSFLNLSGPMEAPTDLINYNGKLGLLVSDFCHGGNTRFELWVLQDLEKKEWSHHVYVFSPVWQNAVEKTILHLSGVVGTTEFVFLPMTLSDPFYVFYYNVEKNTVVRVGVRGMEAFKRYSVDAFANHVENVELIRAF
ncbi:PREDICTED: putative F-box protein At2g19630 [Camelina sativa]|uniref:F-box protein At2g19630 n=1 Tax=Camelina sativa TaxID=90675 RepID=A0ABM0Z403_CAMSA|nr:PREDICTED: putative F-box protein At2g19630 [Camelina sativa]